MEQSQHLLTDADQTIYCLKFLLNTCSAATFCQRKSEEMKEEENAAVNPGSGFRSSCLHIVDDEVSSRERQHHHPSGSHVGD